MLPLEGIKVIEVATWVAGPTCGVLLADCGADVVKIEHAATGGDPARGWQSRHLPPGYQTNYVFEVSNRGKRGLALDLGQEEGRQVLYRLVKGADILITNLRLPTIDSLGIDYDSLHNLNPSLIYGRLTGYGSRGDDRDLMGFDHLSFWARSGIMASLGEPEGPPVRLRGSMGDVTTGTFLFGALMLALQRRERTGQGALVDVSLLGAGAWVAADNLWSPLITGVSVPRYPRSSPYNPLVNVYRCSDEKWLSLCVLQTDRYWHDFCQAIETEDLEGDVRFKSHDLRCENNVVLVSLLDRVLGTRPRQEWADRLDLYRIAWAPVNSPDEAIKDPQMRANDFIVELDHPAHGHIGEIASPFQIDGESMCPRKTAPEFGDSTEEVLLELGYQWEEIAVLKEHKIII